MTESTPAKLPKSKYPWCLRCNKRVEALTIREEPRHAGNVIVEYRCHGETVSQEMEPSELNDEQGLASFTAFNAYTSGLLLGEQTHKAGRKKGHTP